MSMDLDRWIERVARAAGKRARAQVYTEWAASYDADTLSVGYTNHAVAAALVARYVPASGARLLEAGVGTGALGEILNAVGYNDLVGIDISDGMLAIARGRGAHGELYKRTLGEPLGFADNRFTATIASSVFAIEHVPTEALDELVRVTRPSGHLIFSLGTIPWEGGFKDKAESLEAVGRWVRVEDAGPYHPMPLSKTRKHITNHAFVYRVL